MFFNNQARQKKVGIGYNKITRYNYCDTFRLNLTLALYIV